MSVAASPVYTRTGTVPSVTRYSATGAPLVPSVTRCTQCKSLVSVPGTTGYALPPTYSPVAYSPSYAAYPPTLATSPARVITSPYGALPPSYAPATSYRVLPSSYTPATVTPASYSALNYSGGFPSTYSALPYGGGVTSTSFAPGYSSTSFGAGVPFTGNSTLGVMTRMAGDRFGNADCVAVVNEVVPNSPAAKANIIPGDIIVAWNDQPLRNRDNFEMLSAQPGDTVYLQVERNGVRYQAPVYIDGFRSGLMGATGLVDLGMVVHPVFDKLVVHEVVPGSLAALAGVQRGDTLVSWNGEPLTMSTYMRKLQALRPGDSFVLGVMRQGQLITLPAKPEVPPPPPPPPVVVAPPPPPPPVVVLKPGCKPWIGCAVKKAPGKSSVFVKDVAEGGPAETAGLRDGDEIVSFGGDLTPDLASFQAAFKKHAIVGQWVNVDYMRDAGGRDNAIKASTKVLVMEKKKEVFTNLPPMNSVEDLRAIVRDRQLVELVSRAGFAEADEDMSGFITAQEFAKAMSAWMDSSLVNWLTEYDLMEIFNTADVDRSGMLVRSEFPVVIEDLFNKIITHFKPRRRRSQSFRGGGGDDGFR